MKLEIDDTCIVTGDRLPPAIGTMVYNYCDDTLYLVCYGKESREDRFIGSDVHRSDSWYEAVEPDLYYTWETQERVTRCRTIYPLKKLVERLEKEVC